MSSIWQPLLHSETNKTYFHNALTNETTWIDPTDKDFKEKRRLEKEAALKYKESYKETDEFQSNYNSWFVNQQSSQNSFQDYQVQGNFNIGSGSFQKNSEADRTNPLEYFDPASKTARQCSHFFDYESFQAQRNAGGKAPKQKFNKKELARLIELKKKRKHERAVEKYKE